MARNRKKAEEKEKMIRQIYSLPASMRARIVRHYHDHGLRSEAAALRELVDIGLANAPPPPKKRQ